MDHLVHYEASCLRTWYTPRFAIIRFISRVNKLMLWTTTFHCKCFSTHITTMWFISSMNNHMLCQADFFTQVAQQRGFSSVCIHRWRLRLPLFEKRIPHALLSWGLSPVWISECIDRLPFSVKDFLHVSQQCGLSPVWISVCLVSLLFCVNDFQQASKLWGLSPVWISIMLGEFAFLCKWFSTNFIQCLSAVWISICWVTLLSSVSDFPYTLQIWGLSPVWISRISICFVRLPFSLNDLPQISQLWGLLPVWMSRCRFKLLDFVNVLQQVERVWNTCLWWFILCL